MALNPYFLNGSYSEQKLVQDLINEQIKMYGQDVYYLPRKFIKENKVVREVILSKFDESFVIEAYISTVDGFGGQGDILSKFGVRSTDEITFIISKERYQSLITPFISNDPKIKVAERPQEGDLIFLPLDNALFEIKYIEGKRPFYQLNDLYVYEIRCELYEYEDEIITTGIDIVDKNIQDFKYVTTMTMVNNSASSAILDVELTQNKSVQYVDIINGGYGYKSTPSVKFTTAPSGGITATAIAILQTQGSASTIDSILITNPGAGYTTAPSIDIVSSSGSGFIGTSIISNGVLGPIQITNGGSGYPIPPNISISTSPTGQNAQAIAVLNTLGIVTSIRFINAGSGYTGSPSIQIDSPVGISTGNYFYNEIVRGVSTGTSAYVKDWDYDTRILKLSPINGNYTLGELVVGAEASYRIFSMNNDDLNNPYADNDTIEDEADMILDFDEKNPFGDF
jgi:hypothetical protein